MTRIVICLSDEDQANAFGIPFAGYRMVLNCHRNLKMAKRVYDLHNLLQFRFNAKVLAAKDWSEFLDRAKREGRDVYIETDNTDHMKSCIRTGVTGIVTDHTRVLDGLCWESINSSPGWMNPQRSRRLLANLKLDWLSNGWGSRPLW